VLPKPEKNPTRAGKIGKDEIKLQGVHSGGH
jgi:hypothetical protein